jgi:alpha-D-ribose 1-methylphosphonate 5-triphosphate diphosphatase PhnM
LFLHYYKGRDEQQREQKFNSMVNKFIPNYEAAKQTAKNYLGSVCTEKKITLTSRDIASKYKWTSNSVSPIPSSGHFCLDVPAQGVRGR